MTWLEGDKEREMSLEKAKRLGKEMKAKHKHQEAIVKLEIKNKLIENKHEKDEYQVEKAKRKQAFIYKIGLCRKRKAFKKLETAAK